jgi:hypothetical protein
MIDESSFVLVAIITNHYQLVGKLVGWLFLLVGLSF